MAANTNNNLDRLKILFDEAVQQEETARQQMLTGLRAEDPELCQELESLLAADDAEDAMLDTPPVVQLDPLDDQVPLEPAIPQQIGRYRIRRVIARGGMGTVYEAEQDQPQRIVAVKAIRPEMVSRETLRRFEFESRLLAKLHHPGIASVYEAGVDTAGKAPIPYFAMEYIEDAKAITRSSLMEAPIRQRLETFVQLCAAVAHGHQHGVIHRDLKPSNILMDVSGMPRVIDFGVARATDDGGSPPTRQTATGQLIGTLQYMSPEQCAGRTDAVDMRSDVYSLGIVLFELLSGGLPYSVEGLSVYEAIKVVTDSAPQPLRSLSPTISRDIETIVTKATEKDPQRRYRSAAELGDDIQRFLSGDAILARPPTLRYQLGLFARRQKAIFVAINAIFLAALAVAVVSTVMYFRTEQALSVAAAERDRSQATADFLVDTFRSLDPSVVGDAVSVEDLLDRSVDRLDQGVFAGQPIVEAGLRQTIGEAYGDLVLAKPAVAQLEKALEIQNREFGPEHEQTLATMAILAGEYRLLREYDRSLELAHAVLEARRRTLGSRHPQTVKAELALAKNLNTSGKISKSEEVLRPLVLRFEKDLGPDSMELAEARRILGQLLTNKGRHAEAVEMLRGALRVCVKDLGEAHSDTLFVMDRLSFSLRLYAITGKPIRREELNETVKLAQRVIEISESRYGPASSRWKSAKYTLAAAYRSLGDLDKAEQGILELIEGVKQAPTKDLGSVSGLTVELAIIQKEKGERQKALKNLQTAVEMRREIFGDSSYLVGRVLQVLGHLQIDLQNYVEAEPVMSESYQNLLNAFGPDNPSTQESVKGMIRPYDLWGKDEQAALWRTKLK